MPRPPLDAEKIIEVIDQEIRDQFSSTGTVVGRQAEYVSQLQTLRRIINMAAPYEYES